MMPIYAVKNFSRDENLKVIMNYSIVFLLSYEDKNYTVSIK